MSKIFDFFEKKEKKKNLFGTELEDLVPSDCLIPTVISKLLLHIKLYGYKEEGIYRVPGVKSQIEELKSKLNLDPCLLETNLSEYAIHDVSAVLKELLRHLPEPLFPYKTYHDVIEILQYRQSPLFRLKELNHLIKQLSEVRRYVIGKILYHLAVISSKSNHNRMNSKSLAIIFGPVLLRAPLETPLEVVAAQNQCCVKAIELLIEQELSKQRKIKEEQAAASASNSMQAKQQQLIRRITVKRLGRLKNERRYKTDRINQNQVQEALRARGNMLRSHSSPPTLRNTNAYVQNDQRKCPVFDFTDLKRGDQSEGVFTLKRNQKGRLPVRRKKKV